MLSVNINKISSIVIPCFAAVVLGSSCAHAPVAGGTAPDLTAESDFSRSEVVGKIESKRIKESSGLAVSRCQDDVLWTHNDSGDGPYIFAFNSKGKDLGTWKVANAENRDWEDMSIWKDSLGKCYLYLGDIGNSKDGSRTEHTIYRIAEPVVSDKTNEQAAEPGTTIVFSYPDTRRNAETMMVHPETGDIYIVTKESKGPAASYRIAANSNKAEKIGELSVPAGPPGMLTGGDISPDGKRLVISDYFAAYEFAIADDSSDFESIWRSTPTVIEMGARKQGEAISYSPDGRSIFATSEKVGSPVIRVNRR
jgi:hypothetical protein